MEDSYNEYLFHIFYGYFKYNENTDGKPTYKINNLSQE